MNAMDIPPSWTASPTLREALDQHPCLLRQAWPGSTAIWSIAAFDQWLSQGGLGWPHVRLFKDGAEIDAQRYTLSQGPQRRTDLDAVLTEYAAGATLQTIGIDVFHAPMRSLCDGVLRAFAPRISRIHANAYLTPADSRGFDHHWDTHDVLVLQLEGRKHWQVHGAPLALPTPEQVCGLHPALIEEAVRHQPLIDAVLDPGDLLYLPRGQIHAARTAGACSLHVTLGLHMNTPLGRLQSRWQKVLAHLSAQRCAHHALGSLPDEQDHAVVAQFTHRAIKLLQDDEEPAGDPEILLEEMAP